MLCDHGHTCRRPEVTNGLCQEHYELVFRSDNSDELVAAFGWIADDPHDDWGNPTVRLDSVGFAPR